MALALDCDNGLVLIHESVNSTPLRGLRDALPSISAKHVVLSWAEVVARQAKNKFLNLHCFPTKEMPSFTTYKRGDGFYSQKSSPGGKHNGLAWTLKPEAVDASVVDFLVTAINEALSAAANAEARPPASFSETTAPAAVATVAKMSETPHEPEAPASLATHETVTTALAANGEDSLTEELLPNPNPEAPPASVVPPPSELNQEESAQGKNPEETMREQIALARVGQGLFRKRLEAIETCCRLTSLADKSHLRASHIKPWRFASDVERLDGNNGLLLSPHVDHLFDQGYLTFCDDGAMLFSPELDRAVFQAWRLDPKMNVGPFNAAQQRYLAYHRTAIFRH